MSTENQKELKGKHIPDENHNMDEIMKKYDKESNVRVFKGVPSKIVITLLVAFSLFAVYMNLFALWDERVRRSLFVGFVVMITFLLYPAKKTHLEKKNYIPWYDFVLGIVGSGCYFYFVFNVDRIVKNASRISQVDMIVGIVGILILLEACRRSVGIPIIVVVSAFLVYAYASNISIKKMIYNLFYTTEGVIGTPISVCCTYIVLFIIFGAFLERSGISDFFIQTANSIAGASSGGPAKVAVISSALCGMVSGSSVANTVTTGSITIPMMKKTGYRPEFAGAVEAAASTGGQIMPPIMGAAAFLMAEMVGIPYSGIVVCAILPAVLYFTGVFIMVHLEARRLGLQGMDKSELPNFWAIVLKRGYLILPLVILIWMIMGGYTMSRAALIATAAVIVISMFKKDTRITPQKALDALQAAARSTVSVAVACAVAGIIAGVVTMTGLGQILISAIVSIAGNNLIIALFFTMLSCIVLGMGLPTTATYVIMATTCAPILVTGMNVNVLAAHMFVFYFGIV
ncbi:MAG: TRAP transporter fused permease subunit, partial [Lachnospiraceae bacterium]|nr:TRAP transporter fused permease subunit [Lachnospiraceae bacterium]